MSTTEAPWGYDSWTHTEVIPKPAPTTWRWRIGPVTIKTITLTPAPRGTSATGQEDITVQLTADQQVTLTLSGEDRYGNPVDISASDATWTSTDESVVQLVNADGDAATAVAVGPVGTAAVTVSNPSGDVSGGIAIQVVAGNVTEVVVTAGEPTDKPYVDHRRA